ncbi:hypothetical protein CIW48_21205 [Methylobacterium sp. P1-11]|nr:hypothetical protein CIW48_21205 [Methylobacterium sp. P1-11]
MVLRRSSISAPGRPVQRSSVPDRSKAPTPWPTIVTWDRLDARRGVAHRAMPGGRARVPPPRPTRSAKAALSAGQTSTDCVQGRLSPAAA